jgi:hypothetical protein
MMAWLMRHLGSQLGRVEAAPGGKRGTVRWSCSNRLGALTLTYKPGIECSNNQVYTLSKMAELKELKEPSVAENEVKTRNMRLFIFPPSRFYRNPQKRFRETPNPKT